MAHLVILSKETVDLIDQVLSLVADAKDHGGEVVLANIGDLSINCSKIRALIMMERDMYQTGWGNGS